MDVTIVMMVADFIVVLIVGIHADQVEMAKANAPLSLDPVG